MKRYKTRKSTHRYNMDGGALPFRNGTTADLILEKLAAFTTEITSLSQLATNYRSATDALNNPTNMDAHLKSATEIKNRANAAYEKAKAFWQEIYGVPWTPPPSPAPVPA
jgi:hypothetical protein